MLPASHRKFGPQSQGKSLEFDVVAPVEEEDFIQIDGSYKRVSSADVFPVTKPEKRIEGLSRDEWVRFKFGGFRASESFGQLALLDCVGDFHLISFDLATMQLKKDFMFSPKDFEVPWQISCFDFFDRGNLLVGFDSLSQDFCAFNLKKRKKNTIKSGHLTPVTDNPDLVHISRWTSASALAIDHQREFVHIYDMHKGKLKQRFQCQPSGRFTAICSSKITPVLGPQSFGGSFGFKQNSMFKQSGLGEKESNFRHGLFGK